MLQSMISRQWVQATQQIGLWLDIKLVMLRIILTLAISHRWMINQLDISNAFLHEYLDEEVFMQQSARFVSKEFFTHVCKLKRMIYGLM